MAPRDAALSSMGTVPDIIAVVLVATPIMWLLERFEVVSRHDKSNFSLIFCMSVCVLVQKILRMFTAR